MNKRMGYEPKIIHFDGMSMTPLEWAEYLGISRSRLYNRLRDWPLSEALRRDKQNGHRNLKGPRIPVSKHASTPSNAEPDSQGAGGGSNTLESA